MSFNNLDKYEYLTGEDLGLKPIPVDQAKFEYSPLGKVFNKALDKDEKKEGLFKKLKNIEGQIKNGDKKELKPIKNEEQSKIVKDETTVTDKEPKKTVLLKGRLDYIFKNFNSNFNNTEKNFLKKLAKDETKIIIIICFLP